MELRKYRQLKHLTQQNVADFLQIPLRTYANYELGSRKPTPEMLCRLADFFDVSVDELLGRTSAPQLFDNGRIERPEILELFDELTPQQQQNLLNYARGMAVSNTLADTSTKKKRA